MKDFLKYIIIGMVSIICIQLIWLAGTFIPSGNGKYEGILINTSHYGMIWKTDGVSFKTGLNSSTQEHFCVLDKEIMDQLKNLPPKTNLIVIYKSLFSTPSWKCDISDSSDVITGFKVIAG
jgi:hypothetical protein